MASINDFKIIALQSKNYAKYLIPQRLLTEIEQQRFGFYLLVMSHVMGLKDIDVIAESVLDTEFSAIVSGEKNNDEGVDAVVIDEDSLTINLFNFKYRESFSPRRGQRANDAVDSTKFLAAIVSEDTSTLDDRSKAVAEAIIDRLRSSDVWKLNLYMVSNDNVPLDIGSATIKNLQEMYNLEVQTISLDDIVGHTSPRPVDAESEMLLDVNAVMTFEETALSSSKSYLLRLSLPDLLRLTSNDSTIRKQYDLSEVSELKNVKLSLGLLFENVRGYLGDTEYNKNIFKTLDESPEKFFMYNNGITLTADSIQASLKNGGKKLLIKLTNYQIVNGGQTVRSIYAVKDKSFDEENLATASVLVRVFQTEGDDVLTSSIAEYTNSQNAISSSDLKSVSALQVQIEAYLKEHGMKYIRKSGDVGADNDSYKYFISMERLAQIRFSKMGYPDKASNQKKRLFTKYYDDIFNEDTDFADLMDAVNEYEDIKVAYKGKGSTYEQKYFYVMYLNTIKYDIEANITLVEKTLSEYRSGDDLSEPRKLIQGGFKTLLDKKIEG
jgi:hypothetical protein